MSIVFEAKSEKVTTRLPDEHLSGLLAYTALGGGFLADQIRLATNGYLGSSLTAPDFSDEIAVVGERLTSDAAGT